MANPVLPVRVYDVRAGAGVDDPSARVVVTCRWEDAAEQVVRFLQRFKMAGALTPADSVEYFVVAHDVDLDLGGVPPTAAIAQGFEVKSVILDSANLAALPKGAVLGTLAGAKLDAGDAARARAANDARGDASPVGGGRLGGGA